MTGPTINHIRRFSNGIQGLPQCRHCLPKNRVARSCERKTDTSSLDPLEPTREEPSPLFVKRGCQKKKKEHSVGASPAGIPSSTPLRIKNFFTARRFHQVFCELFPLRVLKTTKSFLCALWETRVDYLCLLFIKTLVQISIEKVVPWTFFFLRKWLKEKLLIV